MKSIIILLLLPLSMWLAPLVFAEVGQDKENVAKSSPVGDLKGAIKGKVLNKTLPGAIVPDQEVKLTIHGGDISGMKGTPEKLEESPPSVMTLLSKSDKDGNFIFANLEINEKTSYMLTTEYRGIKYFGGIIQITNAQPEVLTELLIYETTAEQPLIQINREHLIANIAENGIFVTEVMIMENKGDKTYVGSRDVANGKKETIIVTLPKGHDQVQYFRGLSEESAVRDEKKITYTEPVLPGKMQLVFGYRLATSQDSFEWTKTFDYDTSSIDVLFLDTGIKVKSDKLQTGEPVRLDEKNYLRLTGGNIKKGEEAKISISFPKQPTSQGPARFIIIGIVVVLIAASLTYSLMRRRKAVVVTHVQEAGKENNISTQSKVLESERKGLIMEIANLDDQVSEKKISQQEYQRIRDEKKERLIEITKLLGKS